MTMLSCSKTMSYQKDHIVKCAVRAHFGDNVTQLFCKALVPQLDLSKNKNVYCFPEGEKKKKKIFQKPI